MRSQRLGGELRTPAALADQQDFGVECPAGARDGSASSSARAMPRAPSAMPSARSWARAHRSAARRRCWRARRFGGGDVRGSDMRADYPPRRVNTAARRRRRRRQALAAPSGNDDQRIGHRRPRAGGASRRRHSGWTRSMPSSPHSRRAAQELEPRVRLVDRGRAGARGKRGALPCVPAGRRAGGARASGRSRAPRPDCRAGRGTARGRAAPNSTGMPGLHAHLPEMHAAVRSQQRRHMVLLAGGHAAAGDHHVEARRGVAQHRRDALGIVGQRRPRGRFEAVGAQQAHQQFAVAVVDLAGLRAACRARTSSSPVVNTATVGRARHGELVDAERCGERRRARASARVPAREHQRRRRCTSSPARRTFAPARQSARTRDAVAVDARRLRLITTVSAPAGIGAPVVMRTHSPAPTRRSERAAGELLADQPQRRLRRRAQVGVAQREAVHRAVVERRQRRSARRRPAPARGRARARARRVRLAGDARRPRRRRWPRASSNAMRAGSRRACQGSVAGGGEVVGGVEVAEAHAVEADARHAERRLQRAAPTASPRCECGRRASRERVDGHSATSGCRPSSSSAHAPCAACAGQRRQQAVVDERRRSTGTVSSHGVVAAPRERIEAAERAEVGACDPALRVKPSASIAFEIAIRADQHLRHLACESLREPQHLRRSPSRIDPGLVDAAERVAAAAGEDAERDVVARDHRGRVTCRA